MEKIGKGDVILRDFREEDLPLIAKYANNKKVSMNLRDAFPHPYTLDDACKFVEMAKASSPKKFWAIEYEGEYVGNISLVQESDVYRKSAEIGYFIAEPFWNKGIATQAVSLMIEFGFAKRDIVRIHTGVFEYNKASQRVLRKCGFEYEGTFKRAVFKENQLYDEVRFAVIRSF